MRELSYEGIVRDGFSLYGGRESKKGWTEVDAQFFIRIVGDDAYPSSF